MLANSDSLTFSSRLLQNQDGKIRGKSLKCSTIFILTAFLGREALQSYFKVALEKYPHLHFKLINTLIGVNSLVLYYESVNGLLAAETMIVNPEQPHIVTQVFCHYVKMK